MHDQHVGRGGRDGDGIEVLDRVEGHLAVKARIDHERRARDHDRIAVGGRARRHPHADIAAGAALVVDVELLAQALRQFLRN
jgi:transposase